METQPRQGEAHFRDLAESIREVFWILAHDLSRTLYVNRAYEEIFGRSVESLYQDPSSFLQAIHPEDRERVSQALARVQTADQTVEHRIVCPDGTIRWLRVRGFRVRDGDDAGFRIAGVSEDITERKRAEQAERFLAGAGEILSRSLDYHETLRRVARLSVQQIADWAAVYLLPDDPGQIQRVAVAHGDPEKEQLVERLLEAPPPPGHPIRQVIATGEAALLAQVPDTVLPDVDYGVADETVRQALLARSWMGVPLIAGGRLLGAISFVSAESARRYGTDDLALAAELAHLCALAIDNAWHYERARLAIQSRDQVLGLVSHDLGNPLQAIVLTTETLLDGPGTEEERARHLRVIQRASERMLRLIRDLLDVSRIESGDIPLERYPVRVGALLAESCEVHAPLARNKGVRLTWEATDDSLVVHADVARLLQVLSNLIGNAVKFTPEGGEVLCRAEGRVGEVRIEVRDSGIGIAEEQIPFVFDRFWQARHTHRAGAGLGLAIARGIVTAHGGSIGVESEPGRGSTFFFSIPRGAADPAD